MKETMKQTSKQKNKTKQKQNKTNTKQKKKIIALLHYLPYVAKLWKHRELLKVLKESPTRKSGI